MIRGLIALLAVAAVAGWVVTRAAPLPAATLDGVTGDATRGKTVFIAAGCASCHAAPGADGAPPVIDDPPVLAGGQAFTSPFGTFHAPNISSDPAAGLGGWTDLQIAGAVLRGVGAEGEHLYPVFPYTAYTHAAIADVADLIAYLRTLPADATPTRANDIAFPFNIRRSLGVWKALYLRNGFVLTDPATDQIVRGRYLVEALGHCGECHTPRGALGGLDRTAWLGGAADPVGTGRIPNITPGGLDWTEDQIAQYLSNGFTPEFDTAGGSMVEVIANTSRLPPEDRAAIAAYLKAVPPVLSPVP